MTSNDAADRPTSSNHRKRWLIVGGGMMGLKLARDLANLNQDVTVAEAAPEFGGLTSAWKLGNVTWDRFYHATLLSDSELRELLAELDLEKEIRWVETKTGFYSQGDLISMSNTVEFLRFPLLNLIDKLRLGGTIFLASKLRNWRRLEKMTVESWLRRWSGKRVFEKIWLPLLNAKLGEAYKITSAAFIWAHTARLYKARRSGMKTELFGYVPGGYARILDRLQKRLIQLGVTLQSDSPITKFERNASGGFHIQIRDGEKEHYDQVIYTIPSQTIADSCGHLLTEDENSRLRGIRYLGVVCASLLLRKPISPYYVTNIVDTWVPLTAVIEMSTIVDPETQLGGNHLVYLPKYMPEGHQGLDESDADYKEKCLSTLEKMYPSFSRDNVVAIEVARAKRVAALQTIGYSERLPPVITSVPGLYVIHSAQILKGSLNVNETLSLAQEKLHGEVWPVFQSLA